MKRNIISLLELIAVPTVYALASTPNSPALNENSMVFFGLILASIISIHFFFIKYKNNSESQNILRIIHLAASGSILLFTILFRVTELTEVIPFGLLTLYVVIFTGSETEKLIKT